MEKFTYIFLEVTDLNINNQEGQLPDALFIFRNSLEV